MEENRNDPKNLIDTTDNLEAIAVMRSTKNIFFVIVIVCLVLTQAIFWVVNRGCIKTDKQAPNGQAKTTESVIIITETSAAAATEKADTAAGSAIVETGDATEIGQAAKTVLADTNQPAKAKSKHTSKVCSILGVTAKITSEQLSLTIRMVNFVLILSAILYCLTMLFLLKISLVGRLGGINHIARAFFLSLIILVLILPWQRFFPGVVAGVIYTPEELMNACASQTTDMLGNIMLYLRYVAFWVLTVLFLICAQFRSARWAKNTLRRLEVVQ
ncbi:MAG: hypothetical protein NTW55_00605 [Planctomycetota bacterium]|nr:hypothetical protein [Planctomycetota bacterium]